MLLERTWMIVFLGKYIHTQDRVPYGTQEQGSIAESPQPTRKLSSPLCLPDS